MRHFLVLPSDLIIDLKKNLLYIHWLDFVKILEYICHQENHTKDQTKWARGKKGDISHTANRTLDKGINQTPQGRAMQLTIRWKSERN